MKTDPLKNHRRNVAAAERALVKARDELRAAAKQNGLPTAGIFAESEFVLRTTANRWAFEAKHRSVAETIKVFADLRKVMDDPTSSPFTYLEARHDSLRSSVEQPATPPTGKPTLVVDNADDRERPRRDASWPTTTL